MLLDFGQLRNRGCNNSRIFVSTEEPLAPIKDDLWINPDYADTKYVRKTSSETITSSTAMQIDNELTSNLMPNGVYEISLDMSIDSTSSTPDIKVDWSLTNVSQLAGRLLRAIATNATSTYAAEMKSHYADYGEDITSGITASGFTYRSEKIIVYTTDDIGSIVIRWAQNTSSPNPTTVKAGSRLIIKQIGGTRSNKMYYDGSDWIPMV